MTISHRRKRTSAWVAAGAGLCASFVGLGLARFAYTPLIPVLIAQRWFSASDALYLGAANLAGYLAGALVARFLAARLGAATSLRMTMTLAATTCFACSAPVGFVWYFLWRLLAGLAGGVIMVLAPATILAHTAPEKKGLVGGVIFAGVGLGIAASGTLVPLLLQQGLTQAWCGLGALSAALVAVSWRFWPAQTSPPSPVVHGPDTATPHASSVRALWVEYGLNAVALVPHMVFFVDFIARGLGRGLGVASSYWVLYGLGAIVGPLLIGHLADRSGFRPALRVAFLVQAVAVALPAVTTTPASLIVSTFVVGAFTPGVVPLALGRIHELVPRASSERAAWARATVSFALCQAAGAYGLSFGFAKTGGNYMLLFATGACAALSALGVDLVMGLLERPANKTHHRS